MLWEEVARNCLGFVVRFSSQVMELLSSSSRMGDTVRGMRTVKELSGLDWLVELPLHQSVGAVALGGCGMRTCVLPTSGALSLISANLNLSQISQLM